MTVLWLCCDCAVSDARLQDTISNAGTVLRNNILTDTNCNFGRYKSSHSVIEGNRFANANIPNLEIAWLPGFFEGPVVVTNVSVADNTFASKTAPNLIHCGPFCGAEGCLYTEGTDRPGHRWTQEGCPLCPRCETGIDTPSSRDIRLRNNTIIRT